MKLPPPRALADMDGVITDFHQAAVRVHGGGIAMRDIRWGFPVQLGYESVYDPKFWSKFDRGFWASLPWTKEGHRLLDGIEAIFGPENVGILTHPWRADGVYDGKMDWIGTFLPQYRDRVFTGAQKGMLASPRTVLIEDHTENAIAWRAVGGPAVLVPRPWNERIAETNANGNFDTERVLQEIADRRSEALAGCQPEGLS